MKIVFFGDVGVDLCVGLGCGVCVCVSLCGHGMMMGVVCVMVCGVVDEGLWGGDGGWSIQPF